MVCQFHRKYMQDDGKTFLALTYSSNLICSCQSSLIMQWDPK